MSWDRNSQVVMIFRNLILYGLFFGTLSANILAEEPINLVIGVGENKLAYRIEPNPIFRNQIVTINMNNLMAAWMADSGKNIWSFDLAGLSITVQASIAFSDDGRWLAVSDPMNGAAYLFDSQTGELHRKMESLPGVQPTDIAVDKMDFSPDGRLLVGGIITSTDIAVWDVLSGKLIKLLVGGPERVPPSVSEGGWILHAANFNIEVGVSSDSRFVYAFAPYHIRIWRLDNFELASELPLPLENVEFIKVAKASPDLRFIAIGSHSGSSFLRVLSTESGKELFKAKVPCNLKGLNWSNDLQVLSVFSDCGYVFYIDAASGAEVRRPTLIGRSWVGDRFSDAEIVATWQGFETISSDLRRLFTRGKVDGNPVIRMWRLE